MADYIYLMQNRLTPAQWRALEAVRETARTHGMPVFLVGGAVRDLTSGSPVRDLDFAVQGDLGPVVGDLEAAGATVTGRNPVLSSVYLSFRGGVRAEVGPSLTVSFPRPGQAVAQPAPILDDLRRRDFTANAMAISLNEGSYGLLLDPLNGTADMENRELRLVSPYGFIEQPALLLRAARLSERLGFSLEARTESRYQTSKEEGHIQALPAADRGYELEEIFHEEDPIAILEQMEAEGWQETLFPELRAGDADRGGMDAVRDLIGQLESQGVHPGPSAIFFPLITAKLNEKTRAALKQMFARPGFAAQIDSIEGRAKELAAQMTSKAAALPSETWRLLKIAEPEVVLWLAVHTRGGAVQAKIKAFLKDWPPMRQKIPYALMQEMRITPDLPEYEKLLDDLFFALIDGKLDTPEATRAFLEPYSPPAPPQVAVRRRPAKATRGRAKRAAAAEVAEAAADTDAEPEDDEEESVLPGAGKESGRGTPEAGEAEDDGSDVKKQQAEPERAAKEAPAEASSARKAAPKTVVAPKKAAAAKKVTESVQAKSDERAATVPATPAKKTSPSKHAPPATASKPAGKVVPKKAVPAKATPAKKTVPAKLAAKAATAKKAPAKKPPVKVVAKMAQKKTVAKKVPAKVTPPPSKVAAKKQAVKGRGTAVVKRTVPVKAAKKAAVKKRGR